MRFVCWSLAFGIGNGSRVRTDPPKCGRLKRTELGRSFDKRARSSQGDSGPRVSFRTMPGCAACPFHQHTCSRCQDTQAHDHGNGEEEWIR